MNDINAILLGSNMYNDGYNQALDDFEIKIKECCSMVGSCDFEDMVKIKEQLKR